MDEEAKPAKDAAQISPTLKALLDADATGEFPNQDLVLPPGMMRDRREAAEYLKRRKSATPPEGQASDAPASGQEPSCRIGPQNPDHPGVNRNPGGRDPT